MSVRVSRVLDHVQEPYLVAWKLRVGVAKAKEISETALKVGTAVDLFVQHYINGAPCEGIDISQSCAEQYNNCVRAWRNFVEDHPEFLEKARKFKQNMQRELVLGDLVGRPDFIFDDELPDLKTSKSISKTNWMQVAQYAKMTGQDIKRISILRLDKNDPAGVYEYKTLGEPAITFWQGQFQHRYEIFKEDGVWREMERKRLEKERLYE